MRSPYAQNYIECISNVFLRFFREEMNENSPFQAKYKAGRQKYGCTSDSREKYVVPEEECKNNTFFQ
uniref:Uncharacterized protein n=1 Tax=Romanomermis culicivorax TaxID=13658 RepID=A0A915IC36_ROMCU